MKDTAKSNKPNMKIIYASVALCTICVAGYSYYAQVKYEITHTRQLNKEKEQLEIKVQKEIFDTFVNDFISQLQDKARVYKTSRNLIKEILDPLNFIDIKTASGTSDFFKSTLVPDLRQKAENIMAFFSEYQKKAEDTFGPEKNYRDKTLLSQWKKIETDSINKYIDFFANDEQRILAITELMDFYLKNISAARYDENKNIIIFENAELEEIYQALLKNIEDLDYKNTKNQDTKKPATDNQ